MIKKICAFLFLLSSVSVYGQNEAAKTANEIVAEGKKLYRSEMASWYGTDIFLAKFKEKVGRVGGYFSYADGDSTRCIFYSDDQQPRVLGMMSFDSTHDARMASTDGKERAFTPRENSFYQVRQAALRDIGSDTLYRTYPNTNFNLVPIIEGDQRKVYILTGPGTTDKVIFGNDYLLTFDSNNKLVSRKKLHQSILFFDYGGKENEKQIGGIHTHLPQSGDFITPTDICTLMLYEKLARWETHIVVSEKYVSIWNCKTDELTTMPKKAWEKMSKEGKKN